MRQHATRPRRGRALQADGAPGAKTRADAPPPPRVFEHREEAGAGRSRAGREGRKLARLGARMRLVLKAAPMAWHLVSWEARGSW